MQIAEERAFPAGKWKDRYWSRHADVDSDHPCLHLGAELACSLPRFGKDRRGVPILRGVDHLDRLFEILSANHGQQWTKDLLARDPHRGLHVVEDRRTNEISVIVTARILASIVRQLSAFLLTDIDVVQNAPLGFAIDDWTHHRATIHAIAYLHLIRSLLQRSQQRIGRLAHGDDHASSHATLACASECG